MCYSVTRMSLHRGITTWILSAGPLTLAWRRNMALREAIRTFHFLRGTRIVLACGPLLAEW